MKLALKVPTQYSKFGKVIRNNQLKLGNCALKSDLKSIVKKYIYKIDRQSKFVACNYTILLTSTNFGME